MRFELRFRNGYWTLFDMGYNYGPREIFDLKTVAETAVAEANENVKKRVRN